MILLIFKTITKRILNFANENIDILAIFHNIKKQYSRFVVLKYKNRSLFL